jgi:hypothetical protein
MGKERRRIMSYGRSYGSGSGKPRRRRRRRTTGKR